MAGSTYRFVIYGDESLAIACANELIERSHQIVAMVSDATPVRDWAMEHDVPVMAREEVCGLADVDYLLSIANLRLLTSEELALPKMGAINFHDGPVLDIAGVNNPTWAILRGFEQYGITWHRMVEKVDCGDILAVEAIEVEPDETAVSLNTKCFHSGYRSFRELLGKLEDGTLSGTPQPSDRKREMTGRWRRPEAAGSLQWAQGAEKIDALARSLDFGPYENVMGTAKLALPHGLASVGKVVALPDRSTAAPGTVVDVANNWVRVATSTHDIRVSKLSDLAGQPLPLAGDRIKLTADCGLKAGDVLPSLAGKELEDLDEQVRRSARNEAHWIGALKAFPLLDLPMSEDCVEQCAAVALPPSLCSVERALAAVATCLWRNYQAGNVGIWVDRSATGDKEHGYFLKSLPLSLELHDDDSFDDISVQLAQQLKATMDLPPPLCDIGLRYPDIAPKLDQIAALPSCRFTTGNGGEKVPGGDRRHLLFNYNDEHSALEVSSLGVFEPDVFRGFIDRFRILVDAVAADSTRSISGYPMLTGKDLDVLRKVNQTRTPAALATIHELFSARTKSDPDRVAVKGGGRQLTYRELDEASDQLARGLVAAGVRRGDLVGVMMGRGCELLTVLIGVMKAGAAYVPLDRHYPPNRLQYIIGDCRPKLIVVDHAPAWSTDASQMVQYTGLLRAGVDTGSVPEGSEPSDLAYVIYTSGSTGKPKGVQVRHENASNFFIGIDERIGAEPGTLLATTSISFDISVLELFWTLSRGFTVVMHDESAADTRTRYPDHPMGFSFYFWNSTEASGDATSPYDLLLSASRYADKSGFDAVWTPERHFGSFGGHYPNPSVTSAAIATITEIIQIRAGSCVLPLHHPARVAEEWAVVDNLSGGRVGLSMAAGWNPNDFVLKPDGFATAKDDMFTAIEQVRALWRGEAVQFPGPKGPVTVKTLPRPVQKTLPIWITAAGNPDTFRRAGEIGANVLTHLLGQTVDKVASNIAIYREAWRAAGHPGDGHVTIMAHTFVAASEAEAKEVSREPMKAYLRTALALIKDAAWEFPTFKKFSDAGKRSIDDFFAEADPRDVDGLLDFAFERYYNSNSLLGSVDKCVAFTDALKQAGANEIGCLIDFGIDPKTVMSHLPYLNEVRVAANADAIETMSVSQTILEQGVTHFQCTPSRATLVLHEPSAQEALSRLDCLMVGGEPMSRELVQQLRAATQARFFNMYGPTETTVWSTVGKVNGPQDANVIGTPLANQTVHVIDPGGTVLPPDSIGELAIGGLGVTSGYLGRPDLTADRFIEISDAEGKPAVVYRTGDMTRLRHDGRLEFLGRVDDQVKVRGFRIELGEIEASMLHHEGVAAAAAVVQRPDTPNAIIVGFVVPANGALSTDDLHTELRAQLPEFMVPSHLVAVPELPYLPNGKLDRKQLAQFEVTGKARTGGIEPKTDAERALAKIWSELLNVKAISITDNFFELGGHSLLAIQAIDAIEKRANVRLNPRKILTNTLEQLAKECAVVPAPEPKSQNGIFSRWFGRA